MTSLPKSSDRVFVKLPDKKPKKKGVSSRLPFFMALANALG